MRKLLLFLIIPFTIQANAQVYQPTKFTELGLALTATNYSGDLAESHIELPQTKYGAAAFLRFQWNRSLLLRGQVFWGKIAGDDKHSPVHAGRNFKFSTNILEATGALEFAIGTFQYDPIWGQQSRYIVPYIFAGAGAAFIRPEVTYYGPPADRDKFVRTAIPEGNNANRTLLITPFGLGARLIFNDFWSVGLEAAAKPTYSDFLDGVSQNGNPGEDDWYYTIGFTISYYLNGPWAPDSDF